MWCFYKHFTSCSECLRFYMILVGIKQAIVVFVKCLLKCHIFLQTNLVKSNSFQDRVLGFFKCDYKWFSSLKFKKLYHFFLLCSNWSYYQYAIRGGDSKIFAWKIWNLLNQKPATILKAIPKQVRVNSSNFNS